jgi:hypothetical protein
MAFSLPYQVAKDSYVLSLKSGAKKSQLVKFRARLFSLIRISLQYKVDVSEFRSGYIVGI